MDNVKSAVASKALWGAVVAGLAPILALFGIALSEDDMAFLVNTAVGIVMLISTAITVAGSIMAFIGRLRATSRIGGVITADPAKAPTIPPADFSSIIRP